MKNEKRGITIGAFTSQPLGGFVASPIAHHMKEKLRCKGLLMYCDDTLGLARSKAECWSQLNEYIRISDAEGLVIKASMVVAPIAHLVNDNGERKKKRRRQRSRKRPKD